MTKNKNKQESNEERQRERREREGLQLARKNEDEEPQVEFLCLGASAVINGRSMDGGNQAKEAGDYLLTRH
jgi:hypothetical protein